MILESIQAQEFVNGAHGYCSKNNGLCVLVIPISNFQVGNVNPSSWLVDTNGYPTIPRAYVSNFGGWLATQQT